MKKILLIVVLVLLTGCSKEYLEVYQEAVVKTELINDGKKVDKLNINFEFGDSLLNNSEIDMNFFEHITYTQNTKFNKKENKIIIRQFLGSDTIGFDTVYYNNEGVEYLNFPTFGKIVTLNDIMNYFGKIDKTEEFTNIISKESIKKINKLWLDIFEAENVANLGNEVVDTPEGEVKVKKLLISATDKQIKIFIKQAIDILKNDSEFIKTINRDLLFSIDGNSEPIKTENKLDIESLLNSWDDLSKNISFKNFEMATYIDIDKFIVNGELQVEILFKGQLKKSIKSIKLKNFYELYDINEKNEFIFPKLDNTMTVEEIIEKYKLITNIVN